MESVTESPRREDAEKIRDRETIAVSPPTSPHYKLYPDYRAGV